VLYQSLHTPLPAFSYWKELLNDPWAPVLAAILLAGVVAEVRRNALSPILNLGPFVLWLVLALNDRAYSTQPLLILPLVMVIGIESVFYIAAFRRRGESSG
jgi:hypothetical protein